MDLPSIRMSASVATSIGVSLAPNFHSGSLVLASMHLQGLQMRRLRQVYSLQRINSVCNNLEVPFLISFAR